MNAVKGKKERKKEVAGGTRDVILCFFSRQTLAAVTASVVCSKNVKFKFTNLKRQKYSNKAGMDQNRVHTEATNQIPASIFSLV